MWCNLPIRAVCGGSLAGIAGLNPEGGMDVCLFLVSVVCCQVEVSATGRSLVQRSTTDCGVPLCVIQNPKNEAALARIGLLHKTNVIKI
jgi:hypothetical protein